MYSYLQERRVIKRIDTVHSVTSVIKGLLIEADYLKCMDSMRKQVIVVLKQKEVQLNTERQTIYIYMLLINPFNFYLIATIGGCVVR
jgi:hypothetical protein